MLDADPAGRFLVGAGRPQPPAPGPAPQHVLGDQRGGDQHEERHRDRAERRLTFDLDHAGVDVAVLGPSRSRKRERRRSAMYSARVAAIGVNRANRISDPLTSPTATADHHHEQQPGSDHRRRACRR